MSEFEVLGQFGVWQKLLDKSAAAAGEDPQPFFYNVSTDESAWDEPKTWGWEFDSGAAVWVNRISGKRQKSNPAWQLCEEAGTGTTFWYNNDTGASVWEVPEDVDSSEFDAPDLVDPITPAAGSPVGDDTGPIRRGSTDSNTDGHRAAPPDPPSSPSPGSSSRPLNKQSSEELRASSIHLHVGNFQPLSVRGHHEVVLHSAESAPPPPPPPSVTGGGSRPTAEEAAPPPPPPHMDDGDRGVDAEFDSSVADAAEWRDMAGRCVTAPVDASDVIGAEATKTERRTLNRTMLSPSQLTSAFPLLKGLSTGDVTRAAGAFRFSAFKPGAVLAVRGSRAEQGLGAMVVVRGRVRLIGRGATKPSPVDPTKPWTVSDGEVVVGEARHGHVIADGAMLSPAYRYNVSVVALPRSEWGSSDGAAEDDDVLVLHATVSSVAQAMPRGNDWLISRARSLLGEDPSLLSVYLEQIPFIRGASDAALTSIVRRAVLLCKAPKQTLIMEGTQGDAFYVLLHGQVTVTIRGEEVAKVGPGGFFGEMSLLRDKDAAPASATVSTGDEPCLLLCETRSAFLRSLGEAPELRKRIRRHVVRRSAEQARSMKVGCLALLDDGQLERLYSLARQMSIHNRDLAIERGSLDDGVFVVTQGYLLVQAKDPSTGHDSIWRVGAGSIVGVDALCNFSPRARLLNAEAGASGGAQVVRFTRRDMVSAVGEDGALLAALELSLLRDKASLAHIARVPTARSAFIRFGGGHVDDSLMDFIVRSDSFARRAFAMSPSIDSPIPSPPTWLVRQAVYICDTFLAGHVFDAVSGEVSMPDATKKFPVLDYVAHAVVARVVDTVTQVSKGHGEGLKPSLFAGCAKSIADALESQREEFVSTSAFEGIVRRLERDDASASKAAQSSGGSKGEATRGQTVAGVIVVPSMGGVSATSSDDASPRPSPMASGSRRVLSARKLSGGKSAPFEVTMRSRLGQWVPLIAVFDTHSHSLCLSEDPTQHSTDDNTGVYALSDVTRIEQHADDMTQRTLSLWVRESMDEKEIALKFDDAEMSSAFCALAQLIEPDVAVTTTAERHDASGYSMFAVRLCTRAGTVPRVLAIHRSNNSLIRARTFETIEAGKPIPIGAQTQLFPLFTDPLRLKIVPVPDDPSETFEVVFSSVSLRERFCGLLRVMVEGIDVSTARVLGVARCGWEPPQLSVCCATFNCGDSKPAKGGEEDLAMWLAPHRYDIYAIGLQECNLRDEWVKAFSQVLTPSGGHGVSATVEAKRGGLPYQSSKYVLVGLESLWGIHLVVFARAEVAALISEVQTSTIATGVGGVMGNKGGVGMGLVYGGVTTFAFVSCHLAARPGKVRARAADYAEIVKGLRVSVSSRGGPRSEFLHEYDHVFWMGDLNYRIDMGKPSTPEEFNKVQEMIRKSQLSDLAAHDELAKEMQASRVFSGFEESSIEFPPTYRLVKKSQPPEYSNKKYQNASWTDRILFRSSQSRKGQVRPLFYDATFAVSVSDHRPVSAGFAVTTAMPFLNLEHLGSASAGGRVVFQIRHMRFMDVLAKKADAEAIEAGLPLALDKLERVLTPGEASRVPVPSTEELYVAFSAPFLSDLLTSGMVSVSSTYPADSTVCTWTDKEVPPFQPILADLDHLKQQHVILTVRTKSGHLVGQAELPLSSAIEVNRADGQLDPKDLALDKILERPSLLRAFAAHLRREMSGENVDFWMEVQDLSSRVDNVLRELSFEKEEEMDLQSSGSGDLTRSRSISAAIAREIQRPTRRTAVASVLTPRARILQLARSGGLDDATLPTPPQGISAKAAKLLGALGGGASKGGAASSPSASPTAAAAEERGARLSRALNESLVAEVERRRAVTVSTTVTELRRLGKRSDRRLSQLLDMESIAETEATASSSTERSLLDEFPTTEQLREVALSARAIFDEYVDPVSAPAMVNLPAGVAQLTAGRVRSLCFAARLRGVTRGGSTKRGETDGVEVSSHPSEEALKWTWGAVQNLFQEAALEAFKLMATDSLPRFAPHYRKWLAELEARGGGSYFGVELSKHGVSAGYLVGNLAMVSFDAVATLTERLASIDSFVAKKREQKVMLLKSRRTLLAASSLTDDTDDEDGAATTSRGQATTGRSLLSTVDRESLELGSDDEADLMADLMLGSGGASAPPLRTTQTAPLATPSPPPPRDHRYSLAPSMSDATCLQIEKALSEVGGSEQAQELRVLLKIAYQRMTRAERKLAALTSSPTMGSE
jgi:CRP-like cAMP-binding protein